MRVTSLASFFLFVVSFHSLGSFSNHLLRVEGGVRPVELFRRASTPPRGDPWRREALTCVRTDLRIFSRPTNLLIYTPGYCNECGVPYSTKQGVVDAKWSMWRKGGADWLPFVVG